MKKPWLVVGTSLTILLVVLAMRFVVSSGENTWLCQNGTWVKHGSPSSTPLGVCPKNTPTPTVLSKKPSPTTSPKIVSVYFSNLRESSNRTDCFQVFPTEREIKSDEDSLTATVNQLLMGPTSQEREEGFTSQFSEKTKQMLKNVQIKERIAYVNLHDLRSSIPNANSSCGSAEFFASLGATLKQFGGVDRYLFAIEGNPRLFYDWMQIGCTLDNNNCDSTPFK